MPNNRSYESMPDFDSFHNRLNREGAPEVDREKVLVALDEVEEIMRQGHSSEEEKRLILIAINGLNGEEQYWVAEPFLRKARNWGLEAELALEDGTGDLSMMQAGLRDPRAEKGLALSVLMFNINSAFALRPGQIGEFIHSQAVKKLGVKVHPHRRAVNESIESWKVPSLP